MPRESPRQSDQGNRLTREPSEQRRGRGRGGVRSGPGYREGVDLCPSCGAPNPDGFQFCGHCGAALPVVGCPSCGAAIADGQRFCGRCGAGLDGVAARPAAPAVEERKLATVLFADVVGFTSLAERTDPEIVARLVDSAFHELGEIVAEHGGTVDKYMGDSLLAVFGVPIAHDDDAERAVAAAMAMRHLGGDLVFSIGVNSGEVLATAIGVGGAMTVIGDTVNVAARLEKAAGPGEVLCGRLTTELVGRRIAFRARQPVLLKGKQEPVEVWEALSLTPLDVEPNAPSPPLVGRDDELAFLEAQWRRVCRDRQPQVVVVCGDAGSGKTRVTAELAARGGRRGDRDPCRLPRLRRHGWGACRGRGPSPVGPGVRRRRHRPGPVARRGPRPITAVDRSGRHAPGTIVGARSAAPGERDEQAPAHPDRRHAP